MLRFIIKMSACHSFTHELFETLYTVDVDVPEIEAALTSGGQGDGYEIHKLIGVEIITAEKGVMNETL